MSDAATRGNRHPGGSNEKSALVRTGMAAAAGTAGLGGGTATIAFASFATLAGVAIGHLLRRNDASAENADRALKFRVADDLAQYRSFTRLLRDQGARIIGSTSGAATMIAAGLNDMDAAVDRMRVMVERLAPDEVAEWRSLAEAIGAPVLAMLGHLQFQDVTQQQILFLSRLSLILDDHMVQLSHELGGRRAMDRVGRFKEMFDQALGDCVMDSQRDDHHTASGHEVRETVSPRLELF
jgi:hypothetical protein